MLCDRCGFPTHPGARIHSRYTNSHYCADYSACNRRCQNDLTYWEIDWLTKDAIKKIGAIA